MELCQVVNNPDDYSRRDGRPAEGAPLPVRYVVYIQRVYTRRAGRGV